MKINSDSSRYNRIDYLILITLETDNIINPMFAITLKELQDKMNVCKRTCLWNHLDLLIQNGLVTQGGRYNRQNTYYITKDGLDFIKENELYE